MTDIMEAQADYLKGFGTELSPTWRELAAQDTHRIEPSLADENSPFLGDDPIPASRYTSYDYHREEVEKVWLKTWQVACREEEIPEVGDHFVYRIAGMSFIVVRTAPEEFRAFRNLCMHRGRELVDCSGKGAKSFRCAYHAWTWNIDGSLQGFPGKWDFPTVGEGSHDLRTASVARWNGFVFINPDRNAAPLAQHLGGMDRHFADWPLDRRFTLWHVRKTIRANWKVAMEAFLEGYHLAMTHPQALPSVSEHGTQYDIWQEGDAAYSRSMTPTAVPSHHARGGSREEAIAVQWALLNGLRMDDAPELPENIHDRATLAQWRRDNLSALTGADYADLSDAMMLDSIQYWLFPNFCPWLGEGLPLTYVFRPDADMPDTCYMDAWMLVRMPDDAPAPSAPAIIELGPDDPFEPHIGAMGEIFDQDDFNMPKVQIGMKQWPDDLAGVTLGRYQESRIRFLHKVLEERLGHTAR
ncbi:aromatic ring-hydroxylating oxygenase subunit alpha [Croceicoccus mobilis]|uniref:(2Fe-2S)-binding protein n=1 Tax=Croceicoccus mobilis TaxID=1703339 RepID=A0A917DYU8_9SPHN|nr:aromatic ring-hydroxylating dioxygenase subunit alpha [Croceicoccus mobilis]GGD79950.1 (2Fe-2S)-binding protein [Croceicoccus mobilis]